MLNTAPDFLTFLRKVNFNFFGFSINALCAACRAEICDKISGEVGFFFDDNLLSEKFSRFVLRPKTNCAGINPIF